MMLLSLRYLGSARRGSLGAGFLSVWGELGIIDGDASRRKGGSRWEAAARKSEGISARTVHIRHVSGRRGTSAALVTAQSQTSWPLKAVLVSGRELWWHVP